jgi:uncharacterized membrane protein
MNHPNARLEALCDGVFAIAMTLLILDVRLSSPDSITSSAELWRALGHVAPLFFAFVLSFGVILITWVNHRTLMRLVDKTSLGFIYANGFLLLSVVVIPFPSSLLGEFLWTDHAVPAVVVYDAILAMVSIGWIVVTQTALRGRLTRDEHAAATMLANLRNAYFGLAFYSLLAIMAIRLPIAAAIGTTFSWIFWLIYGIRLKHV